MYQYGVNHFLHLSLILDPKIEELKRNKTVLQLKLHKQYE